MEPRIVPSGNPPVAVNESYTVQRGQILNLSASQGVLVNDTDPESDVLTAVLETSPTHNIFTLNPDGGLTYQATTGFLGADSFTYHAFDGTSPSNTVTVTITVTEASSPPTVTFSASQYNTTEDNGGMNIQVTLSQTSAQVVTVGYTFSALTATADSDYTVATPGTLVFQPGETSKAIWIAVIDDTLTEANETVALTLSNPTVATPGQVMQATLTILDNDAHSFTWTNTRTQPPIFSPVPDQTRAEGEAVSVQISGSDPEGRPLSFVAVGLPRGLTINHSTGLISGTIDHSAAQLFTGHYESQILVADGEGGSSAVTIRWTVSNTNRPPIITEMADQSSALGGLASFQVVADDPDIEESLFYEATGLPAGLHIDFSTGLISGIVSSSATPGSHNVTISVSDPVTTVTESFHWIVTADHAPTVTAPGNQTHREGDPVSLQIQASVTGGGTLTFGALGLPEGLSIDQNTGLISGTISNSGTSTGVFDVTIAAFHGAVTTRQTLTWTIQPYVTVEPLVDQATPEGQMVSLQVVASTAGGTLSYSAEGLPSGVTINSTTGFISGIVVPGNSRHGPLPVSVAVMANGFATSRLLTWTVTRLSNTAPILSSPGSQTSVVGDIVSVPITVSDADNDLLSFTADGLPPGLCIDSSTGELFGELPDTAVRATPYQTTVTVTNGHGGSASSTFSWTVNDGTLTLQTTAISGVEGAELSQVLVGIFTDTRSGRYGGSYGATVIWGDGQSSTGFVVASETTSGTFEVYADHRYLRPGTYSLSVEVVSPGGTTATASGQATVAPATLTATGGIVVSVVKNEFATHNVAYFCDANRLHSASEYSALVQWNDGTTSPGVVAGADGTFVVATTKSFSAVGDVGGTVLIADGDGQTVTASVVAAVGHFTAGSLVCFDLTTFHSAEPLPNISATVSWGDDTVTSGLLIPGPDGTFTVRGSHVYDDKGVFQVQVSVSFPQGDTITSGDELHIVEALPTTFSNLIVRDGSAVEEQLLGVFADPNYLNTAAEYTAFIDWGNGETGLASQVVQIAPGLFQVFGGHVYQNLTEAGSFVVRLILGGAILQVGPGQRPGVQLQRPVARTDFPSTLLGIAQREGWYDAGGQIRLSKINTLIDDPKVQDREAAVVAILKALVLQSPSNPDKGGTRLPLFGRDPDKWDPAQSGLTEADIMYLLKAFSDPTHKLHAAAVELDSEYEFLRGRTLASKYDVYSVAPPTKPLWETVQQGFVGDCSFLAATMSLLNAHGTNEFVGQKRIDLVAQNPLTGRRTYEVTFGDLSRPGTTTKVTLVEPTHSELALYGGSTEGHLWLSIWEKAYIARWAGNAPLRRTGVPGAMYDVALPGQAMVTAIANITGHTVGSNSVPLPNAVPNPLNPNRWEEKLAYAIANKKVITAATRSYAPGNPALQPPPNHAFAVVGYDKANKTVTVANPHNNKSLERPWGGVKEIKIADFQKWFGTIAYEGL
jgi:VCBS repeat-containing protein